jgi:hypothetical protein
VVVEIDETGEDNRPRPQVQFGGIADVEAGRRTRSLPDANDPILPHEYAAVPQDGPGRIHRDDGPSQQQAACRIPGAVQVPGPFRSAGSESFWAGGHALADSQ